MSDLQDVGHLVCLVEQTTFVRLYGMRREGRYDHVTNDANQSHVHINKKGTWIRSLGIERGTWHLYFLFQDCIPTRNVTVGMCLYYVQVRHFYTGMRGY